MTDPDRGAYTPQTEEPLSFDARRPSERRPVPMTLIGSAIVLVALIGGVALVYRGGVRGTGEGPRPVGEPVMSVKTAAAPGAPARDGATGLDLYSEPKAVPPPVVLQNQAGASEAGGNTVAEAAPAPTFAAAPEQPAPRPAPKPGTVAMLSHATAPRPAPTGRTVVTDVAGKSVKSTRKVAPANEDETEVAAAGATTRIARTTTSESTSTTTGKDAPIKLAEASPSKHLPAAGASEAATGEAASEVKAAKSPPVAPSGAAPLAKPGSAVVQIGAFSSSDLADKGYADVAADMAGRMSGKSKHVLALDVSGKTLYRTWVSGFGSRADAVAFCEALKAKSKSCIVKS